LIIIWIEEVMFP